MKTLKTYLEEHNEKSEVGYGLTNLRILSLVDDVVLIIIVTAVYNKQFLWSYSYLLSWKVITVSKWIINQMRSFCHLKTTLTF